LLRNPYYFMNWNLPMLEGKKNPEIKPHPLNRSMTCQWSKILVIHVLLVHLISWYQNHSSKKISPVWDKNFYAMFWWNGDNLKTGTSFLTLFLPAVVTWRSYMCWFRPWPVGIRLRSDSDLWIIEMGTIWVSFQSARYSP
jgi:hypothetical protein